MKTKTKKKVGRPIKGKLSPVKEIRNQIRQAYYRTGKINGRNKLEKKYIAKLRYMLFFLGSGLVLCKKKLIENWEMPDDRIVNEVMEKGGRL